MDLDLSLEPQPPRSARGDFRIGVIGASFVIREVQLLAYRNAGYNVAGIASRSPEIAHEVAGLYGIVHVYDTYAELLRDPVTSNN